MTDEIKAPDEGATEPPKRYVVTMDFCRVTWLVDGAGSPEAAVDLAWDRYEAGHDPDEIDCSGSPYRVREVPRSTLAELLREPQDEQP